MLSDADRRKLDDGDDGQFYDAPRYVTHADDAFLARLTDCYDDVLSPGDSVLDAMGSWVSHLSATDFSRVVGHGLNAEELAANERYDEWFVQDFNTDQSLPFDDDTFDAVCCALSVQYLQYPAAVFAEFERVLVPGGVVVVSFTNRMFATKAIRAWRAASMAERATLVERAVREGGMVVTERITEDGPGDPFYAVVGRAGDTPEQSS